MAPLLCRQALSSRGGMTKKRHDGRLPASSELDRQLLKYVQEAVRGGVVNGGVALGDGKLQQVAREYAKRLGLRGFKASGSWLRGWKGRCLRGLAAAVGGGAGVRGVIGGESGGWDTILGRSFVSGSEQKTVHPKDGCLLSVLTEKDRRGVVIVGGAENKRGVVSMGGAGKRGVFDRGALTLADKRGVGGEETPGDKNDVITSEGNGGGVTKDTVSCGSQPFSYDYSTPEHNYSRRISLSRDSETTPPHPVLGTTSHSVSHDNGTTPTLSKSQPHDIFQKPSAGRDLSHDQLEAPFEDLLESVVLLQEEVGMEVAIRPEEVGVSGAEPSVELVGVSGAGPEELVSYNTEYSSHELSVSYCGHPEHAHSDFFAGHAPALLEDDQLISMFNHRSVTDHFPYLPASLFSSNWCPPYDITVDGLPSLDQGKGHMLSDAVFGKGSRSRKGTRSRSSRTSKSNKGSHYHTRSKTREACVGVASEGANEVGSTRTYCISPSTFLETGSPPPTLGGVSLMSPPPPGGSAGMANSSPGGLLANRLSQPVFPDEPEIVFHEIQLGPLHTMQ